ncbi:Dynamin-like GTPase that mediates homotypic ER fusion [Tulasnella sp. JGI-2019a]|nr:Dynamin-like GTPase that mediates homotypic ER fusion [Tulasnella sp. JGI-2019a]
MSSLYLAPSQRAKVCLKNFISRLGLRHRLIAAHKGTLLNSLFGTTFNVMKDEHRGQTTRGLCMSRAKEAPIIIMDVEGADSRERGEDLDFQRKAALFSLASTEVLIVNLWEKQVGLHEGANMVLLKDVFEVNLSLFGFTRHDLPPPRTLLLFVIRDHDSATPLSNIQEILMADLGKIWGSINKPEGRAQSRLDDYFDVTFVSMANKIFSTAQLEADIVQFHGRFADRAREDYVFKPEYHRRIPADGMAHYMEDIWNLIQNDKDINLPTQQELLSQFQCDKIAAEALEEFKIQSEPSQRLIAGGHVVEELGRKMRMWKDTAIAHFDASASRYQQSIYSNTRNGLVAQLNISLRPLFSGQLNNLRIHTLAQFVQALQDGVHGQGVYDGGALLAEAQQLHESSFESKARECIGLGPLGEMEEVDRLIDPEWSYELERDRLKDEMGPVAVQFKKDETKKLLDTISAGFMRQITAPVLEALLEPTLDVWELVLPAFRERLATCEETYRTRIRNFHNTDIDNDEALYTLQKRAWLTLTSKIKEETSDDALEQKLWAYFEKNFEYDDVGVPRTWTSTYDLGVTFVDAKDKTLKLLKTYSKVQRHDPSQEYTLRPPPITLTDPEDQDFDFTTSKIIIRGDRFLALQTEFSKNSKAVYFEAKQIIDEQYPQWTSAPTTAITYGLSRMVPLQVAAPLFAVCYAADRLGVSGPLKRAMREGSARLQAVPRIIYDGVVFQISELMALIRRLISKVRNTGSVALEMRVLGGGLRFHGLPHRVEA